ncbi:hypothetical protein AAFF_G00083670 [Aldrovandia affinis]|uniref:Cadherin domain-containing protein n=1 Tax=Aldrovandia affinis TaxID=143900 RepID=A0AAD7RZK4_9TELE|nr:hypothetical protein AAFF_G00083670 [Aldrovandia affinis]
MSGCIMKVVDIILLVTLYLRIIDSSSSESRIRQKRAWIIDSFTIEEEHPGPFPFKLGKVHVDRDYRVAFKLHGSGVDEDPKNILKIDEGTGVISVFGKVDYEQYQVLKLKFEARNVSNQQVDTRLGVEITILDINDHPPKFQMDVYETSIEESKNQEFFIEENGRISFRGCLDYEKAEKYTIVVEAKDCGEVVRLSSSSTVIVHILDKNNHPPVFIGRTGTGQVKERASGISPMRIHIKDEDTKGTAAWRAKYTINGDRGEHFQIQTDPETNDGILTVINPLDYEEGAERHLSITVENKEPYFSCQVKRKTSTSLWMVTHIVGDPGKGGVPGSMTENITIIVEDVNDPPEFTHHMKDAVVEENIEIGHSLDTFTARDPDGYLATDIEYVKGDDPGGWVKVDSKTGEITTAKILDRESPFVMNSTYVVTLYAVDKGNPPMTGTGTLTIHLKDKNDNLPQLHVNTISMCFSDATTMTNITAYDLDDAPYSGPFRFELLGDVKGKWSLDSNYGTTVNLIKKGTVYAGPHELQLKIYDRQEHFSLQNLSVTVCDCSIGPNCLIRGASSTQINGSAIGIIFAALLVLLGVLLLSFLLTCEREKIDFPFLNESGDVLLSSNIEKPGTDCQIHSNYSKWTSIKQKYLKVSIRTMVHIIKQISINRLEIKNQPIKIYTKTGRGMDTIHMAAISCTRP